MLRCHDCKTSKPIEDFAKNRNNISGYNGICKACKRIRDTKHYAKNRARIIARNKQYNQDNKEWYYAYCRDYNMTEAQQAYREDWKKQNPEYSRLYYESHKSEYLRYRQERRSRIANNGPIECISIDALYDRDLGICGKCSEPTLREDASIDHITAVVNGGTHTWDNVQLSHLVCNKRKGSS